MRISAKLSLGLFAIFVAFLLGATFVLTMAFQPAFSQLEARLHRRDVARVEARLTSLRDEMTARVRDYAEWDDTYNFIVGRNRGYVENNFTDDWLANYNVDLALILDDQGRPLWRAAHDQNGDVIRNFNVDALVGKVLIARPPASGVAWTPLGPMLFVAMPSTGTSTHGAPRGMVLFARRLSAQALKEEVRLDVRLIDPAYTAPDFQRRLQNGAVSTWTGDGRISSLIPLRDVNGQAAGAILTAQSRDIVALGNRVIGVAIFLFTLVSAIACGVLWFLIRKVVVSPLASLERDFARPSQMAEIAPVDDADSADEIGGLKRAYNQLVARVHESRGEAQEAHRDRATAEAANQMKSQFLANMSHELRTPLNAIIGYAELTLEQLDEAPVQETRSDLEKIVGAARHQLRLVNEVLDLARIEAGGMALEVDVFDGGALIEETARIVRPLANANGSVLRVVVGEDLGALHSDAFRLKQCLINVAGNACKFTRDGTISISARRVRRALGDTLEVQIADTGIGMSPEQIRVLFQPFVQADASITRRFGGSGLGLAITGNVIRLLGGEIKIESKLGEGSVFTLLVPVGMSESAVCEPEALIA